MMYTTVIITGLVLLITHFYVVGAECNLPENIQRSKWNDTKTNSMLNFGIKIMTNWNLKVQGSSMNAFTCITNSTDVYVFKSDSAYYDVVTNTNKRVYLCLRMMEVTENLFYFYILADMADTNGVSPSQRLYIPQKEPNKDDPVCNYCQSNEPPKDSEYHLLRKDNTDEVLNTNPTICLPCNATCQSNDGTAETTKSFQMYIIIIIAVAGFLLVLMVIICVVVCMKRRKTQKYEAAATKETEMSGMNFE